MTLIDLKTSPQNILIVARGGIGNVLMFMPTLKGLKKRFPNSDVYMLVDSKGSYELLSGESSIKEVILYDQRANGIIRLLKFILTLRRKHFNLAIVMHPGGLRSALWAFISGAKIRIGYDILLLKKFGSFLYTHLMKPDDKMHDVEQNFKILSSFGNGEDDSTPIMSMTISDDLKRFAREYMVSYGITDEDKIIGIHPGSNSNQKWKRWPAQYFGELINIIISEWESYVLVFGDHKEDDLIKDILSHVNESSKVNGITDKSLMESAALISLCKVFIGNDSGLLHIAAATNVITFCIAGPTNINKTSPYGSNSYKVHLNLECQFCYNFNTLRFKCSQISQYKCLKELYPKEVYKEIYPVLSQILI